MYIICLRRPPRVFILKSSLNHPLFYISHSGPFHTLFVAKIALSQSSGPGDYICFTRGFDCEFQPLLYVYIPIYIISYRKRNFNRNESAAQYRLPNNVHNQPYIRLRCDNGRHNTYARHTFNIIILGNSNA